MTIDPIVEEIHQARTKLLAEHGGSLTHYLEDLQRRRKENPAANPITSIEQLRRRIMRLVS